MLKRVLTGAGLVLTVIYLIAIQNANGMIQLPFIFSFPSSLVLALAGLIGYGVSWLSHRTEIIALKREVRRLTERAERGNAALPSSSSTTQETREN